MANVLDIGTEWKLQYVKRASPLSVAAISLPAFQLLSAPLDLNTGREFLIGNARNPFISPGSSKINIGTQFIEIYKYKSSLFQPISYMCNFQPLTQAKRRHFPLKVFTRYSQLSFVNVFVSSAQFVFDSLGISSPWHKPQEHLSVVSSRLLISPSP